MARRSDLARQNRGEEVFLAEDSSPNDQHISQGDGAFNLRGKAIQRILVYDQPFWLIVLFDVFLIWVAFVLAYYVRYDLQVLRPVFEKNHAPFRPFVPYVLVYLGWLVVNYRGARLYRLVRGRSWVEEVYIIINGVTNATLIIMAISFFLQPIVFSRLMLVYGAGFSVILLSSARIVQRVIRANLRASGIGVERVLIVGVGEVGQSVLRTMIARKELGYLPVGYLDDDPNRGNVDLGRVKGLGKTENLSQVIDSQCVDTVVITLRWQYHDQIMMLVQQCRRAGVNIRVVPDLFQLNMKQVDVQNLDGIPLLGLNPGVRFGGANRLLKRAMDLLLIVMALPILIVFFALVIVAIRLDSTGPVFYSQKRIGENGKPFTMFKFRTMIPDAEKYQKQLIEQHDLDPLHPKLENDPRSTRIGRLLRRSSLDELPNLFNVVMGHMSLVGPRPPTPDETKMYEPWHRQRLSVSPGITGLWQVSGRSDIPFEEMCLLDIYYIENWSIARDIQILLMTIPRVLFRNGAY